MNFLVGDNGSGKTLLSRSLTGDIKKRSIFTRLAKSIFEINAVSFSLKADRFDKKMRRYYIPPEPTLLCGPSIDDELAVCDAAGAQMIRDVCASMGVSTSSDIHAVPYSVAKVTQLALVPTNVDLVFLDEALGSIDDENTRIIVEFIMNRINNKEWQAVVVTTNRPEYVIGAFLPSAEARP